MVAVRPEVVITFGPSGISGHEDHTTIHRAATEAFHRYRPTAVVAPRLYYVALPPAVTAPFAFHLHPSEMTLSVCMDIAAVKPIKLQGLRMYRSQRDAQELAVLFASEQFNHEWFYQAYPVLPPTMSPARGLWHEVELDRLALIGYLRTWCTSYRWVAYLGAAANVSRLLPSPLSDVNQPIIRSRDPLSRPHPAHLTCLCAHLSRSTPRSSTGTIA
jgi:hypothetical protein